MTKAAEPIPLSPAVQDALEQLTVLGIYGDTGAEVATYLVRRLRLMPLRFPTSRSSASTMSRKTSRSWR